MQLAPSSITNACNAQSQLNGTPFQTSHGNVHVICSEESRRRAPGHVLGRMNKGVCLSVLWIIRGRRCHTCPKKHYNETTNRKGDEIDMSEYSILSSLASLASYANTHNMITHEHTHMSRRHPHYGCHHPVIRSSGQASVTSRHQRDWMLHRAHAHGTLSQPTQYPPHTARPLVNTFNVVCVCQDSS